MFLDMESSEGPVRRGAWAGLPVSALTALPACPACYPAYAGLLGSLGLGSLSGVRAQAILTAIFLVAALGALLYRARSRRGLGPFLLGLGGSLTLVVSKYVLGIDGGTVLGVALLIGAGLWNVWPSARFGRDCEACSDSAAETGAQSLPPTF